jgi:hypothetical protein
MVAYVYDLGAAEMARVEGGISFVYGKLATSEIVVTKVPD